MARQAAGPESKAARAGATPPRRVSAEEVVARVLQAIDEGVFQPGDRLREQDLANRFCVSRGPVREALRMLEAKSLVRIEPMRGATITRLSDHEAREAVEISAALFGLATRRACRLRTPEDVSRITKHITKLADMLGDDFTPKEFFQETLRAGYAVLNASGSNRVRQMVEDVRFGAPTYYGPLGFTSRGLRAEALETWHNLVAAIEIGDENTADRLGRKVHDDAMSAALKVVG